MRHKNKFISKYFLLLYSFCTIILSQYDIMAYIYYWGKIFLPNKELNKLSLASSEYVDWSIGAIKLINFVWTVYLIFRPLVDLVSTFLFILLLSFCKCNHCLKIYVKKLTINIIILITYFPS